jgi:hypothetical protein
MSRTPEQHLFLANSAEFQKLIADDPVLKELDDSKIDFDLEGLLLWDALGGFTEICGMKVSPLTPAIYSNLWLMRHPLATGGKPRYHDVCTAVFMLTHSFAESAGDDFGKRAEKYAAEISLTPEIAPDVWRELVGMVERAEFPLKMLPQTHSGGEPVYDADWLLSVCSVAAAEAGITLRDAALNLPLSVVYGLMVVRARKANPSASYRKHTPEWISKATLARVNELGDAYLEKNYPKNPVSEGAERPGNNNS